MGALIHTVASFTAAVLTGLGVGSGGLYLLYLTLLEGTAQAQAQGMNLLFSVFALAAGAFVSMRRGLISKRSFLTCLFSGLPFTALGALIASTLTEGHLGKLLGTLLIAGGISVLWESHKAHSMQKVRRIPAKKGKFD